MHAAEQVGPHFSLDGMRQAQQKSWAALQEIALKIKPGMTEFEATQLAIQVLSASGVERLWHPVIIRFGTNSCKIYSDASSPDTVLQEDDIFFIDLGPVYHGHEGDVGATFVVGQDPMKQHCAKSATDVFHQVQRYWRDHQCSGTELYQYATRQAAQLGYEMNLEIKGHRVSDYPHRLYGSGKLGEHTDTPAEGVWVLEIQLKHPQLPFGAFYEDVLFSTEYEDY